MIEANRKALSLDGRTILVTGSPGFIGAGLVMRLLKDVRGSRIISLDNMNSYYDVSLKEYRLKQIGRATAEASSEHVFIKGSITDKASVEKIFAEYDPSVVVNLAAQAGVRYSVDHPDEYIETNIVGFFNILEACRNSRSIEHMIFASSSSVYGSSTDVPFRTDDRTDSPVSLYAATKKSDEVLACSYSALYGIPVTGLRFFTVYGPAGRPDMMYYSAAEKLRRMEKIPVFNYGDCWRDFTYVDDVTEGIVRVMQNAPFQPAFALYNIGAGHPVHLKEFVRILHEELKAADVLPPDSVLEDHIEYMEMQPGDVPMTYADTSGFERDYRYRPQTDLRTGLRKFAEWYGDYIRETEREQLL